MKCPSRGKLRDCEIFVKVRCELYLQPLRAGQVHQVELGQAVGGAHADADDHVAAAGDLVEQRPAHRAVLQRVLDQLGDPPRLLDRELAEVVHLDAVVGLADGEHLARGLGQQVEHRVLVNLDTSVGYGHWFRVTLSLFPTWTTDSQTPDTEDCPRICLMARPVSPCG